MTVAETLSKLHNRMYVIGETTGGLDEWQAAIACAAAHIEQRVSDVAHSDELLDEVVPGSRPLTFAAECGYPRVVEILLKHQVVRDTIEWQGDLGLTAWQLSNLAVKVTGLVLNPTRMSDPFRYVPLMVQIPYYTDGSLRPYHTVRALLESAGAETNIEPARAFVLGLPYCAESTKTRIRNAPDLLEALYDSALNDRTVGLRSLQLLE